MKPVCFFIAKSIIRLASVELHLTRQTLSFTANHLHKFSFSQRLRSFQLGLDQMSSVAKPLISFHGIPKSVEIQMGKREEYKNYHA